MHLNRFFVLPFLILFGTFISYGQQTAQAFSNAPFIVVLDAGHGGHDPGNLGNGYMEKNIALNIVLDVGKILEREPDIKVIYTRKDDSFVDLYLRGKIANDAHADLFVSVHCDSHSSDAHGAGTFVLGLHANQQNFEIAKKENSVIYLEDDYETRYAKYDINSPESIIGLTIMQEEFLDQSILLAKLMQDEFSGKLKRNDRKVKQAGFIVLHQTVMPSVLVETGFLTNDSEGKYLNSTNGQQEMGGAIADAILTYKQNVRNQPPNLITASVPTQTVSNLGATGADSEKDSPAASVQGSEMNDMKPDLREEDKKEMVSSAKETTQPQPAIEGKSVSTHPDSGNDVQDTKTLAMAAEMNKETLGTSAAPTKEETPEKNGENPIAGSIIFKVQLLASSRDMPLRPSDFKGLGRLSKEPYKNLYRYLYGNTSSFSEAQMLKSNADMKGYTSSFIVAYKDGLRIPVEEAMKYVKD